MPDLLASAAAHHRQGRLREAEALYRRVLGAQPENPEALHLLGLLAHQSGHDPQAAALIRRAIAADPGKAVYHFNLGIVLAALGKTRAAETAYREALRRKPDDADAHNNLGLLLEARGRAEPAAESFRRATQAAPRHAEAQVNLGRQLLAQDRAAEARACFEQALSVKPALAEAHFGLGTCLGTADRWPEAASAYRRAVEIEPAKAGHHAGLGDALMRLGRPEAALSAYDAALERDPDLVAARYNRGQAFYALRRLGKAEADFSAVLDREGGHPGALINLGAVLVKTTRMAEAAAIFRRGQAQHPGDARFPVNLASALEGLNDLAGAKAAARQAAAIDPQSPGLASITARLAYRSGRFDEARRRFEAHLTTNMSDEERTETLFDLGFVLDRLGEAAPAFAAFVEGNARRRESPEARRADGGRFLGRVEASRAWFTGARLRAPAGRGPAERVPESGGSAPVFFVGFPRSGTTLMERALAAHPGLVTTEERSPLARVLDRLLRRGGYPKCLERLSAARITALRKDFWTEADSVVGPLEDRRLVDKLPLNIVDLGFANLLFPEARVVVALRDPRDACLSCFMQRFQLNDAMANFLDLEQTARTYAAVMGLWLHYRGALTLAWHEYRYEDLVENFEGELRRALDFIGAGWHDDVGRYREKVGQRPITTPSYRQVTRALYKDAIGRWRAYRSEMAPVLPTLEPLVAAFGYPED